MFCFFFKYVYFFFLNALGIIKKLHLKVNIKRILLFKILFSLNQNHKKKTNHNSLKKNNNNNILTNYNYLLLIFSEILTKKLPSRKKNTRVFKVETVKQLSMEFFYVY